MIDTLFVRELQEAGRIDDRIAAFSHVFSIGTLLNKAGIKKLRGASPKALFAAIFLLPFIGANFYRGIAKNHALTFKKNAAYALLRNPRHNWRRFLSSIAKPIIRFMEVLTGERRVKVFVIDDTVYDRHRSKKVEHLSTPLLYAAVNGHAAVGGGSSIRARTRRTRWPHCAGERRGGAFGTGERNNHSEVRS